MEHFESAIQQEQVEQEIQRQQIGPSIIILRKDVATGFIRLIQMLWLLAGLSFITCITVCISVNVGYVAFKTEGAIILVTIAFAFFMIVLWSVYWSLLGTFIRMCRFVWSCNFNQELLCIKHIKSDRLKSLTLVLVLSLFVGAPLITVASVFGFSAIVNVFCALLTLASCLTIILVNVIKRTVRMFTFFKTNILDAHWDRSRQLISYLASTGNDKDSQRWLVKGLRVSFIVYLAAQVFSQFKLVRTPEFIVYVVLWISGVLWYAYRQVIKHRQRHQLVEAATESVQAVPEVIINEGQPLLVSEVVQQEEDLVLSQQDQKRLWRKVVVVFIVRTVLNLAGIAAIMYLDMTDVRSTDGNKAPIARNVADAPTRLLVTLVGLFWLAGVARDLLFFVPMPNKSTRVALVLLAQLTHIIVAIYGYICLESFSFTAAVLMALLDLDYREGRLYWTVQDIDEEAMIAEEGYLFRKVQPLTQEHIQHRRSTRAASLILTLCFFYIIASLTVGFASGSFRNRSSETDAHNFEDILKSNISKFRYNASDSSPICTMRYSAEQLSLIDLNVFSISAYRFTYQEALAQVNLDQNLKDQWTVGLFNLAEQEQNVNSSNVNLLTGVRFIEYRHKYSNVSVIAIRGTHSLEDVFQDLYLFFTSGLLQISSYLGTLINIWPIETVSWTVAFVTRFASYPNLIYYGEIEKLVGQVIRDKNPSYDQPLQPDHSYSFWHVPLQDLQPTPKPVDNSQVILTGHSLGAALAFIVAAKLRVPAVGFSSPGLAYQTYNYNITKEALMTQTVNVVPLNDPVPQNDLQISQIQNIPCDADTPTSCHSLERTAVTLLKFCGIPRISSSII